jgi:tetratricopeptide (TPR) repeat protein
LVTNRGPPITSAVQHREIFDEALANLRAGNAEGAASKCAQVLESSPGDVNFLCLAARAAIAQQKFDEARRLLDEAVRIHPDFAVAHDGAGDLLFAEGYVSAAVRAYEQALRLDPTLPGVLTKIEKAQELIARAEKTGAGKMSTPSNARRMAYADEIRTVEQQLQDGDTKQAEDTIRGILKRDPNHVEAARLLARIATDKKIYKDAEVYLRHAAGNAPDYTRIWVDLANVLKELEREDEALECAEKVLELAPEMAESHLLHASMLGFMGRQHEAIASYKKALEITPDRPGALCSMAHHMKTVGDREEAIATYRRCMDIKPDHSEAYWSLANLKTFQFSDREIEIMYELLDGEYLDDEARVQFHNALGLDRESRGDYDTAFSHFEQCNRLRRQSESYDPVETETRYDRVVEVFNEEFLAEREGFGDPDPAPIFVVGLPRSGSTLIEQILASHSAVDGTHELTNLASTVRGIRIPGKRKEQFPDTLFGLNAEGCRKIGTDYLDATRKYRSGATYFIDKNPNNFVFTGLLRLALPNAKIINARRHPLDSCFGTYKQLFASGQPFSYDLVELGEYYLQYVRLMDHWHQLMPGYVLDVQYENVVADLETQVRRILDFCGLPFEESCLRFHETERAVKTASSEQVRRPIYSSSVHLWRKYESHLGDLIEVLEPLLSKLPAKDRPLSL